MLRGLLRAAVACLALTSTMPAVAQTVFDKKYYRVSISGFPIGHVEYESETGDGLYQVQGFMGSSGFFGIFISTRYSGAVIGEVRKAGLRPKVFRGRFETGRKFAQVDISYAKGRATEVVHQPPRVPRPTDTPLNQTGGALDPISALYLMLRDVRRSDVCKLDFEVFEGVRTSRIVLGDPTGVGETIQCHGNYSRLGGFTDEQLGERVDYPFLLEYAQGSNGRWRVTRFLATTDFGIAKAVLRDR